ncbi:major facilitator superfamily domain-containing protein [Boletus reticuloceps]|uniref:Major facilitator superfamily domain-containing protein n=1 Tax=Boletus reticuloceps TaxID=495285 RepID=A0A8I2YI33_9AGAM|nr:major facilitator superfamily domain-containing protein [Boletus reticuloceps]
MSSPAPGPHAKTLVDGPPKRLSLIHKLVLLLLFSFAHFLQAFSDAALFPAIPLLEVSTGITGTQSAWIISAFKLTFASFLLISGRISDVYSPKKAFIAGVSVLGILSIGAGFVSNKIAFIALRSVMGIAAALTTPSALTLLVHVFPEPLEQARAIGVFGGCGAFGNVLGLLIGAVLVQYISYHWAFWIVAIIAIPVAFTCILAIPPEMAKSKNRAHPHIAKWKSLDLIGIFVLTAALILFIYALTSGSADGWATAGVLTPLIISIFLIAGFFHWETIVPAHKAAIPPRTWFYNNFAVLFGSALVPIFWLTSVFIVFTTLWQDVFHWTIISTAVHLLPIGVASFIASCTGSLSRRFSPKWIILTGYFLTAMSNILCAVGGGRPEDYWTYIFPAFIIGGAGTSLAYTHTIIAIFQATPASMAGTVGAIISGALEFGSAVGLAAFTSIQTSVEATHGGPQEYYGRAAAFWFFLGIALIEILSLSYFYQRATDHGPQPILDDYDVVKVSEEMSNENDEVKNDTLTVKESRSLAV